MGTLVRRRWRSGAFYAEKRTGLLTSRRTPLYTARPDSSGQGPCGGIGRRARLKIEFRKECWFDSGQGHQIPLQEHPKTSENSCKTRRFTRLSVPRHPQGSVGIRQNCWYKRWYGPDTNI